MGLLGKPTILGNLHMINIQGWECPTFTAFLGKELYAMSKETTKIDEFWSHSWHVEPWKKILCLLSNQICLNVMVLFLFAGIQCCSVVVLVWFCKYVYDIDLYCFFFMGIIADKLKLVPGSKNWLVAVQIPKGHIGCILYIYVRFRTYLISL